MPPPSRRRTTEPAYEVERERAMVDAPNVTPIREPIAAPMAHASASTAGGAPVRGGFEPDDELGFFDQPVQHVANGGSTSAADLATSGLGGFESPFDDELETLYALAESMKSG